jgi:hypothetical protein
VLKPTGAGRTLSSETDDSGRFSIVGAEPGEYTLEAHRDGYLTASRAYRGKIRMSRVFALYSGNELRDITFRLEPWGAVEGRVHFDDGEPAYAVPVVAYQKIYGRGRLQYRQAGGSQTNDRGEYRIAGLTPGSYVIAALYNRPVRPKNPDDDPNAAPATELSYATTFYTSGQRLADAVAVKLESGSLDAQGLDIFLSVVRSVRVTMRVTDTCTGGLATKATVQLYRMDDSGAPVVPVNADIETVNGKVYVRGLGTGQYLVTATSDPPPGCAGPLRDRRLLTVAEFPVEGIELAVAPPVTAKFLVSADDTIYSSEELSAFTFHLEARSGLPGGLILLDQKSNAANEYFALIDSEETYDLFLDRKMPDAYLKSPLRVSDSAPIMIGTHGATLTGTVVTDGARKPLAGASVTLVPDPAKDRFQRYAEVQTNTLGMFGLRGIAPGRYIVIPWVDAPPCDFQNWDGLEACRRFGTSVEFNESEPKNMELVLKQNN